MATLVCRKILRDLALLGEAKGEKGGDFSSFPYFCTL